MAKKVQSYLINLVCLLVLTVTASAESVPLWGRWEQTFTASTTAAPETPFAVQFTSPSGRIFTVAGFWDGGVAWRVRCVAGRAIVQSL
jgi:hypothetical protein